MEMDRSTNGARQLTGREKTRNTVYKRALEICHRLVTPNPWHTEAHQNGADVLVFEFDRTMGAASQLLKAGIVLRFYIALAGKLRSQHFEIIGNDQVDLLIGPVAACRAVRAHAGIFTDPSLACLGTTPISPLADPATKPRTTLMIRH